jgi:hypothetical protein
MSISKQAAIQLIEKYISEFENAKSFPAPRPNPHYEGAFHGASTLLWELFGEEEANRFRESLSPSYSLIGKSRELEVVVHYFYNHVDTCISVLRTYQDKVEHFMPAPGQVSRSVPITDNIFIIHGHDEVNLLRLRKLLRERYKLNPIVLSEVPSKGRTLIEKFESEASNVGFAFAVMDVGRYCPDERWRIFAGATKRCVRDRLVLWPLGKGKGLHSF